MWYSNLVHGYGTGLHEGFFFGGTYYSEAIVIAEYNGQLVYGSSVGTPATIETPSAVPLPAAGWLLIAGLGGISALRRKRQL